MVYAYVIIGLLALSGLGTFVYQYSNQYTDMSQKYTRSEFYDGTTLVRLYRRGIECEALKWTTSNKPPNAEIVSPVELQRIVKKCKRYPLLHMDFTPFKMYPGTKWCGRGNLGKNKTDLGRDRQLDTCCRDHDFCPVVIHGRVKKFGVKNSRFYTSTHCSCDDQLHSCLKQTNSTSADFVGRIFFNYLRVRCFHEYIDPSKADSSRFRVKFRKSKYY